MVVYSTCKYLGYICGGLGVDISQLIKPLFLGVGWLAMKTHHVNMILQQCAAPARSQKSAAV